MYTLRLRDFARSLLSAALLLGGCGGESAHSGAPSNASGATGGLTATGGESGSGGASAADGGTTSTGGNGAKGGDGSVGGATGGSGAGAASGSGGTAGNGGAMPSSPCTKVTCPGIPTSCKRIVQDPGDCCPTCLDTGCDVCPDLACADGTHSETTPGACCPSCVADPPDACATGQKAYADLRAALLDKYGSSGCSNSTDCTVVSEINACNAACNVALPTSTAGDFTNNLTARAQDCATCPAPEDIDCEVQLAACVNGHCTAVDPAGN